MFSFFHLLDSCLCELHLLVQSEELLPGVTPRVADHGDLERVERVHARVIDVCGNQR